jgi:Holliday junction resolvase RusA-like endonuclease
MAGEWRNATEVLTIVVRDMPQPQGSKKGFPITRKNGKIGVSIVSDNHESLKTWRGRVIEESVAAKNAHEWEEFVFPLTKVPVAVQVTFTRPKPLSEPKRKRTWPIRKPDLDKQTRAVGDALKAAGIYTDDAQVVEGHQYKDWPLEHTREGSDRLEVPGAVIRVWLVKEEEPS